VEEGDKEVTEMRYISAGSSFVILSMFMIIITGQACAQETEHIKWYGFGGELYDPYRWLGRIGIT
jgi:hypothetical protein